MEGFSIIQKGGESMSDLIVTSLSGQSEMLTGYKKDTLAITEQINGEYSLSLELLKNEKNIHAYDLVQEEAKIECDGQEFTIKNITEKSLGNSAIKSIQAEHIFFGLIDHYYYDQLIEGVYSIDALLSRIFNGTGYTYSIEYNFQDQYFENFGLDNVLSLVNLITETFGAKVSRNNKHVAFRNKIGNEIDFQFRYRHNTKTISKSIDTTNLSTVIKGYADVDEYGIYHVESTYRSPLADVYGERHATPIFADDLVLASSLNQRLQESINDKPEISYSLEFVELKKNGFPIDNFELGDTVFTIWEPLNIDIKTQIISCTRYPESSKSPVVTLANHTKKATDIIADFARSKQNFEKVLTDGGKIKFSAMQDAIKRATVALNNSLTQLEYPENGGIIGRDPTNPNKFVVFRSNGIGITVDGGQTFKEAITADGFVLSAGVIGKLTANNIELAPKDIGALDNSYAGRLTKLTPTGIYTGRIEADQVDTTGLTSEKVLIKNDLGSTMLDIDEKFSDGTGAYIAFYDYSNRHLGTISQNVGQKGLQIYSPNDVVNIRVPQADYALVNNKPIATREWVTQQISNAIANHINSEHQ